MKNMKNEAPLKVKVIKENDILPIGSVCNVLGFRFGDKFAVRHTSMEGTYEFIIPTDIVEEI